MELFLLSTLFVLKFIVLRRNSDKGKIFITVFYFKKNCLFLYIPSRRKHGRSNEQISFKED